VPDWRRLPVRWARAAHPAFVGRQAELAAFEDVWSAVTAGARQVVFLGGEPGAGKSRLLAEVSTVLHRHGAAVLLGGCVAEFGPPYQPFVEPVEMLLTLLADGQLPAADAGGPHDRLVDRLSILSGRRIPSQAGAPEREYRRQLYDAVADACLAVADQCPLVLALEDLQWASPTALQLLTHVVERTAEGRILVLATHRTTAPDRSDALVHAIAQLYRHDGVRRLDLAGLDTEDITDFLVREAGVSAPRARLPAAILRDQTGGNPFFLRELWRDLLARGGLGVLRGSGFQAPVSVRDTIQSRLDRLAAPQRQTLEVAAVIGEEFDLATLLATAEWTHDTTLAALDVAVASGLVEAAPGPDAGGFRFPHALARQAVLDLMPPSRLAREHARVGEVLEQRQPASARHVQRLAHHFSSAPGLGHDDRAVRYLIEAARLADRSLAHEDAATWFPRAAALTADPEAGDELRLAAARSALLGGDFARARALDEQVATTGGPRTRLRAAIGYEAASWRPGHPGHRCVELLRSALQLVERNPTDPVYVRAVASLGRALAFTGATDEAGALGARAMGLARALLNDDLLARTLQASLWYGLRPGDAPAKLERATELSSLAARTGDLGHLGHAAYYRGVISYLQGEPDGLAAAQHDLVRTARATGQGFFDYMAGCLDYGRQFRSGQFAAAERTCTGLLELGESFGTDDTEGPYGAQMFMLRRETGALESIRPIITGQEQSADHWAPGLLAVYTELELHGPAERLLRWLLDHDLPRYQDSAQWPGVLAFLVEAALWLQDEAAARELRPLLAEYAGLNLVAGQFVAVFGCADRYLGAVDSLLGHGTAEHWFVSALEMDTRMGAPLHQAETLARHALHLRRLGADRRRVDELTTRARSLAEPLGLRRVLRLLSPAASSRSLPVSRDGLTPRETEVLALLGEGLSNREIAERLVISENTAANHVRSILAKTGSANRTQAAMYGAARDRPP